MKLHPAQQEVARDNSRFKVLNCGRGFGKTALAIELLLAKATVKGKRRVAYIGPTIQQTRDIAWLRLLSRTQEIASKSNQTTLDLIVPTKTIETSTIVLRGWEAIETLRGQEFDMIVIDEVASMRNFWLGWNEVLRPTLRMSQGPVVFISSPKGFNHFYDLFNTKLESWKSFHFTSYDNPFLPKNELELAKAQMPEDAFAQEYMADFRKMSGLIYKEFLREKHLKEPTNTHEMQKFLGIDFGFTDPLAMLVVYKDTAGTYWVTEEYYKTGVTEEAMCEYAKAQDAITYPDPANPQGIEALRRKGVRVRDVVKGPDSVFSGINKVKELFIANKLFISPKCLNLISEIEQYVWDDEKKDKPLNGQADHLCDVIRYIAMMTYFREALIDPPRPIFNNPMRFNTPVNDEENDSTPLWLQ